MARRALEQRPHHHHLHVFELDRVRLGQPHRALYPRGAKVQKTHALEFVDGGRGMAGLGEARIDDGG
jgi:hypothetical protein